MYALAVSIAALHVAVVVHSTPTQIKLVHDLLDKYDKKAKPMWDNSKPINVSFSMDLYQILELRWYDEFLYWIPEDYQNISELRLPYDSIWLPDTTLYNSVAKVIAYITCTSLPSHIEKEQMMEAFDAPTPTVDLVKPFKAQPSDAQKRWMSIRRAKNGIAIVSDKSTDPLIHMANPGADLKELIGIPDIKLMNWEKTIKNSNEMTCISETQSAIGGGRIRMVGDCGRT
ncbi:hypothetical protein RB195_017100 [Necator americanus]|uniref:Neurotransmitter-gated ion-channel ligand-binding domain-containing protein n=1 Tax=Necator americanus TaxID=51031 RepID=A0ABR1C3L0_NECAM